MFFVGMCLWGSQRVTTLKHSHSTVLPSMLQVSVYFVVVDVVVVVAVVVVVVIVLLSFNLFKRLFFTVQALSCGHSVVAVEATLSIQRLVKKYGSELHVVAWDAVLDITEALQEQIEVNLLLVLILL